MSNENSGGGIRHSLFVIRYSSFIIPFAPPWLFHRSFAVVSQRFMAAWWFYAA
jgi:hypothetical protein